jgi:hypothetical protein
MLDFDALRQKINNADSEMKKNIGHIRTLKEDAERVSAIAGNPMPLLNELDHKFEQATKLSKIDVSFLFLATALQVVRQYFVTNFKERLDHGPAGEDAKKMEGKVLGKETKLEKEARMNSTHPWYRPSIEEVSFNPVPFDQTANIKGGGFEHKAKTPGMAQFWDEYLALLT